MSDPMRVRIGYQALGVAFLLVIASFIGLSVATYRKVFTESVPVRVETDHVGNQVRPGADVKIRGMIVGEVAAIRSDGDHAVLELALQPDKVDVIPANVSVRLLPKTLFGERYVALQLPAIPDRRRLSTGDVITQDRSSVAVELERVLSDLLPLLRSVQPEKLSATLNSLSTALAGRGEQFGDTLIRLNDYLTELNPELPTLTADIEALASVSENLADAAPDLVRSLSDLTTTSTTVVDERTELGRLYGTLTNASIDLTNFLRVNRDNLINLAVTAGPTLDVLAKYAPEYPCVLQQIADRVDDAEAAFGKGTEHPNMMRVTLEITGDRGKYLPGVDTPRYADTRGPRCYEQVPHPGVFPQYPPGGPIEDGSEKPPPPRAPGGATGIVPGSTAPQSAGSAPPPTIANSPEERRLVGLFVAPVLGVMPDEVPGWSRLLVAPVYRGMEVVVR